MQQLTLNKGWTFKEAGNEQWMKASVPGEVHMDLLRNKIIDEPFDRLNERSQQWIGQTDWEYQTTFEVDENLLRHNHLELLFKGLDTYADVYLNGTLILSAENMFRSWRKEVKSLLQIGENHLYIYFHNVFKINGPKWEEAPYRLMAVDTNDQADIKLSPYTRKAGFHFGWDWGPRLVTSGVWRPVYLQAWNDLRLDGLQIIQRKVDRDKADLEAIFEVESDRRQTAMLQLQIEYDLVAGQATDLEEGLNKISIHYTLENPDLWWTNGLGDQPLYAITGKVIKNDEVLDEETHRIGIRSLNIIREADDIGQSFYIELNGVAVFMKGANYIPMDNFQSRVSRGQHERLVKDAVHANMNMLRVWGGGIFESDDFYELCDENGLLVWQDMMFACAMYPADDAFLQNVAGEVKDNVKRLRNHPSLALYCGNNEVEMIWNINWKEQFPEEIQQRHEQDIRRLFHESILKAIREVDDTHYYLPTSPDAGYADRPANRGNLHYWDVWHGKASFDSYKDHIGRFMTEYGFQSYPPFSSIKKFSEAEDWSLHSDVMHSHQRCTADNRRDLEYANRLITDYMQRDFRVPNTFRDFIYVNQLLQAEGVGTAIEAHRRHRADNECMGTLYWQINDCWPVASWSSTDYYGQWKALHYKARKLYRDVIVSIVENDGQLQVFSISDRLVGLDNIEMQLQLIDMEGNIKWKHQAMVRIEPNTSQQQFAIPRDQLIGQKNEKKLSLVARLYKGEQLLSQSVHHFTSFKNLDLPRTSINSRVEKHGDNFIITLRSDQLAKFVCLELEEMEGFFSDNYFDLLPGETVDLNCHTPEEVSLETFRANLSLKSLVDTYNA